MAPIAFLSLLIGGFGLAAVAAAFLLESSYDVQRGAALRATAPEAALSKPSPAVIGAPQRSDAQRPAAQRIVIPSGNAMPALAAAIAPVAQNAAPQISDVPPAVTRTWPRLKPRRRAAGVPVVKAIQPGAVFRVADDVQSFAPMEDFTGGRETLFTDYAQARSQDRKERAYRTIVLGRGEALADSLVALGGDPDEVAALLAAADRQSPTAAVKPGMAVEYAFERTYVPRPPARPIGEAAEEPRIIINAPELADRAGEAGAAAPQDTPLNQLVRLRFRPDSRTLVTAWRTRLGGYDAQVEQISVQKRYAAVGGVIRHSLFAAAQRSDVPPEIMVRFANLFLYDVDYARDIRSGDRFESVYEVFYDETGAYVGSGDILFAGMSWGGNRLARGYFRFDEAEGMEMPYFDEGGESATRMLMKTPIEGARVTSSFGVRRHPVSGYTKAHKGVDFGAPSGTPIMAAGDGKVVRAEAAGSFGNYVKIQHAHGYQTAYAHLKGFAKGVSKGVRVRQGDIIGYVGSTGRSTGPHLHYEVHQGGKAQNPMTLEVANGRALDGTLLSAFEAQRRFVNAVRVQPFTVAAATNL